MRLRLFLMVFVLSILSLMLACCSSDPPPIPSAVETAPPLNVEVTTLPDPEVEDVLGSSTPVGGGNGLIAFSSYRDGESEIFTMRVDGTDVTRLTNEDARLNQPTWSPDGTRIAFVRRRAGEFLEIYIMNSDGTGQIRVAASYRGLDFEPAWSPDGSKLAFSSSRDSTFDSQGIEITVFNIYVIDVENFSQTQLTSGQTLNSSPSWSPDGDRIAFQSLRDGDNEIFVMDAEGAILANLSNHPSSDTRPVWSPDGETIAFVSDRDGNENLYLMDADGSNQRRVTSNPSQDKSPGWSPDGQHLSFYSDREGNFEIYTIRVDGSELKQLTNTLEFDGFPSWQPIVSSSREDFTLSEPRPEDIEQQRALNLLTWLSANAIPVTTIEPSMRVDDLQSLQELIAGVKVVDLRGLTLGSHESFTIRHRLLQFLIRQLGFDTIAIDVSRDDGNRINQYLQTGEGDPAMLLAELDDPRWNTQEMLAIIEWIYRFNQDQENEVKINLYGVGMDNPLFTIDLLVANLMQMDLGSAERREFIYDYLGDRGERLVENVDWLLSQISPTSKIALFGYDFEILGAVRLAQDDFLQQITFHPTLGSLLRDHFQEDPFRFGFAFGKGLIHAYDSLLEDRSLLMMQVPSAPSGSFEWFAHNIALPIFIVPTKPPNGDESDTVWLDQPLRSRMIIGVFSTVSPEDSFHTVRLSRAYDAMIYVDQTTPPQILPPPGETETDPSDDSCPTEGICIR